MEHDYASQPKDKMLTKLRRVVMDGLVGASGVPQMSARAEGLQKVCRVGRKVCNTQGRAALATRQASLPLTRRRVSWTTNPRCMEPYFLSKRNIISNTITKISFPLNQDGKLVSFGAESVLCLLVAPWGMYFTRG